MKHVLAISLQTNIQAKIASKYAENKVSTEVLRILTTSFTIPFVYLLNLIRNNFLFPKAHVHIDNAKEKKNRWVFP